MIYSIYLDRYNKIFVAYSDCNRQPKSWCRHVIWIFFFLKRVPDVGIGIQILYGIYLNFMDNVSLLIYF